MLARAGTQELRNEAQVWLPQKKCHPFATQVQPLELPRAPTVPMSICRSPGPCQGPRSGRPSIAGGASHGNLSEPDRARLSGPRGAAGRVAGPDSDTGDPTLSPGPHGTQSKSLLSPSLSFPIYNMGPFGSSDHNGVGTGRLCMVNCEVLGIALVLPRLTCQ